MKPTWEAPVWMKPSGCIHVLVNLDVVFKSKLTYIPLLFTLAQ